jgi:hypothetical protein
MDKIVLSLDDLAVDSFTPSSEEMVIGDVDTGCVSGCATGCGFDGYNC